MNSNYGNALLIYGGGLCDSANAVMRKTADQIVQTQLFDKVFVGFNSFEAMLNPLFIKEWGQGICQCFCHLLPDGLYRCHGHSGCYPGWGHGGLFHAGRQIGPGLYHHCGDDLLSGQGQCFFRHSRVSF